MNIRTTVDIPAELHGRLRQQSEAAGVSVRSLIVRALEEIYSDAPKGRPVTGPLVRFEGTLGPAFPVDENPYDAVFS